MTAQGSRSARTRCKSGGLLTSPLSVLAALVAAAASFIAYVLWPTWPSAPAALNAPALPITVAGVLFQVPPAAIRARMQRHAGPQERLDLAFLWPSLLPPQPTAEASGHAEGKPIDTNDSGDETGSITKEAGDAPDSLNGRLFVTIVALGSALPPIDRLNSVYPQYVRGKASAGADGLAILPFRAGTPYEGEDLVYVAGSPDQFFARCTRPGNAVPATCIHERALGADDITLRFSRDWLDHWRDVAASFDRLIAQLHPQGK
jgi:hypothetical protein